MRAMLVSFASYQLWLDWKKTSKFFAQVLQTIPGIHYSQIHAKWYNWYYTMESTTN